MRFDPPKRALIEEAQSHAGLIGDDDDAQPVLAEGRDRFARAGSEADARRLDVVRHVFHQRAVLVDEHRGVAAHGHELSRIGMTMTSGMTVSSGSVSRKRIVAATFAGSCSTPGSMSG